MEEQFFKTFRDLDYLFNLNSGKISCNGKKCDINAKTDSIELVVFLPGYQKQNIKLQTQDDVLIITTKKFDGINNDYVSEFTEKLVISNKYNLAKMNAKLENGILKINIPKIEGVCKDIEIE